MQYTYKMKGTCATEVRFELEDGKVSNVEFKNGCNGNLKAIAALCEGADAAEIAKKLAGNKCGYKSTSCADQFSKALTEAMCEAECVAPCEKSTAAETEATCGASCDAENK